MEQMWQVCEIEDSLKSLSERFSAAAVPELWIQKLEDGSLICYWPKVNPGQKIRTRHVPQKGDKCSYYKCRLLMNGDKFPTYKEARVAEKDAQNFSSIMDCSAVTETCESSETVEKLCDSTMDFDVSDDDEKNDIEYCSSFGFDVSDDDEKNDIEYCSSFGFDVSDIDNNEEQITGNDSFEFNRAILKGGQYVNKKRIIFEVEDHVDCDVNVTNNQKSDLEDYNSIFKFNDNFLTSTLVDELEVSRNIEQSDDFVSKISTISLKVSCFVETIQRDLNDIVEMARSTSNKLKTSHDQDVPFDQGKANVDDSVCEKRFSLSDDSSVKNQENDESKQDEPQALDDNDSREKKSVRVLNVEILNLPVQSGDPPMIDQTSDETFAIDMPHDFINVNETVVSKSANFGVSNGESEKVSNNDAFCFQENAIPEAKMVQLPTVDIHCDRANEALNDPIDPKNNPEPAAIKLPNDTIPHYEANEELLDYQMSFEQALVKHLEPLDEEDENTYMNRAILTVFTEGFFLDSVSWKDEKNRVNMKRSNTLVCWKESYEKKFRPDPDNMKFKSHFRRFKSALRASKKKQKAKGRMTKE